MGAQRRSRPVDGLIADLAERQHGLITWAQLLGLGLRRGGIDSRVRHGRLHRLHRGIYLVGFRAPSHRALELGAVLAMGPGSVLSHRSAARFWELLPYLAAAEEVDVTVVARKPRRRAGIRVHETSSLPRDEWTVRDGIAVTQPPRTLLDLAAQGTPGELERAVNEAHVQRLVGRGQLERIVARHPGRVGTRRLAEAAGLGAGAYLTTRSPPERTLVDLLLIAGLPPPETNAKIGGYEVDLLWRDRGLVVELDAWSTHGSRPAFERDRRRDARLAALGLAVVRVTADRLRADPDAAVVAVRSAWLSRPPT